MCDGMCWFCGREATTVDHVNPRSRGGNNTSDNLLPACQHCNNLKGDQTLNEFRHYLKALIIRDLFALGLFRNWHEELEIVFFGEGNDSPLAF